MLVKEFRPDLVVLDVMLPDINGKEVCQRVRSDRQPGGREDHLHFGDGRTGQDRRPEGGGANDFMHKPFTVDRLLDRACDLLEMERAVSS